MTDYLGIMNEQKALAKRLDKGNYQKAFSIAKEFFPKDEYAIRLVVKDAISPNGRLKELLTLDRIADPNFDFHIKQLFMHFYEAPLDDPFMQELQVDTYTRSKNSHMARFFKKDSMSGLYLMDDFHVENMTFPEEKLFLFQGESKTDYEF